MSTATWHAGGGYPRRPGLPDSVCQQGGHLRAILRQLVDEDRSVWTQSHPPPARGVLPCRHAPACGRPGDARHRSTRPAGDPVELHLPGGHGLPLQVAKDAGQLQVEWLGMETDYVGYRLGLSPKRASWLVDWLRNLAKEGRVEAKPMSQGLGRLSHWTGSVPSWRPCMPGRRPSRARKAT